MRIYYIIISMSLLLSITGCCNDYSVDKKEVEFFLDKPEEEFSNLYSPTFLYCDSWGMSLPTAYSDKRKILEVLKHPVDFKCQDVNSLAGLLDMASSSVGRQWITVPLVSREVLNQEMVLGYSWIDKYLFSDNVDKNKTYTFTVGKILGSIITHFSSENIGLEQPEHPDGLTNVYSWNVAITDRLIVIAAFPYYVRFIDYDN